MVKRITLLAICMLATLAEAHFAKAQQAVPSYRPNTPTLSPYLYLTRPNAGPFPNYQTFVQPLENQRTTNQIAQQQIIQLQQNQKQLQQTQLQQFAPTLAPTGVGGTFDSLSHFYPASSATRKSAPHAKPAGK